MNPNMPSSGRVDVRKAIHDALNVLAELDHSFDEFAALSEAHAAVVELIDADKAYDIARVSYNDARNSRAAFGALIEAGERRQAAMIRCEPQP